MKAARLVVRNINERSRSLNIKDDQRGYKSRVMKGVMGSLKWRKENAPGLKMRREEWTMKKGKKG